MREWQDIKNEAVKIREQGLGKPFVDPLALTALGLMELARGNKGNDFYGLLINDRQGQIKLLVSLMGGSWGVKYGPNYERVLKADIQMSLGTVIGQMAPGITQVMVGEQRYQTINSRGYYELPDNRPEIAGVAYLLNSDFKDTEINSELSLEGKADKYYRLRKLMANLVYWANYLGTGSNQVRGYRGLSQIWTGIEAESGVDFFKLAR